MLQPPVMAAYLIMLHTGDSMLSHGTVVTHTVFRELSLFPDKYIQHHPQKRQAEEEQAYD